MSHRRDSRALAPPGTDQRDGGPSEYTFPCPRLSISNRIYMLDSSFVVGQIDSDAVVAEHCAPAGAHGHSIFGQPVLEGCSWRRSFVNCQAPSARM